LLALAVRDALQIQSQAKQGTTKQATVANEAQEAQQAKEAKVEAIRKANEAHEAGLAMEAEEAQVALKVKVAQEAKEAIAQAKAAQEAEQVKEAQKAKDAKHEGIQKAKKAQEAEMARVMAIIQAEAAQAKEAAAKAKEAQEAKKAKEAQKAKEAKEEAIQQANEAQEAAMARDTVLADILRYLANEDNFAQEEMRGFATLLLSQVWADDIDDLRRGERMVGAMIVEMGGVIDSDEPIFEEMRSREGQLYWRIQAHKAHSAKGAQKAQKAEEAPGAGASEILRHRANDKFAHRTRYLRCLANDEAPDQPGTQDPLVSGARGSSLALGSTFQGEGKEPKFGSIPTPSLNDDPKAGKHDALDEAVEVPKAPTKKAPAQVPCGEGRDRPARGRSARLRGPARSGPLIDHSKQRG
jgi:chemotaxis protein histidine kinase CheA